MSRLNRKHEKFIDAYIHKNANDVYRAAVSISGINIAQVQMTNVIELILAELQLRTTSRSLTTTDDVGRFDTCEWA